MGKWGYFTPMSAVVTPVMRGFWGPTLHLAMELLVDFDKRIKLQEIGIKLSSDKFTLVICCFLSDEILPSCM